MFSITSFTNALAGRPQVEKIPKGPDGLRYSTAFLNLPLRHTTEQEEEYQYLINR